MEDCWSGQFCVAKSASVKGGYTIDATEVTRSQYAAWLATEPTNAGQPAPCSWNTSYAPSCAWPPPDKGDHPVVCVDWCDAYAYCKAVDKRLCGKIGGGPNAHNDFADSSKSQWYNACSSGGEYNFPYGGDPAADETDGYDAERCNGKNAGIETSVQVGSLSGCQSPASGYYGGFDLSGNVWEWEDACDEDSGDSDPCACRGGSHGSDPELLRCAFGGKVERRGSYLDIGFRCCSP